jgi:hypothetical protein
MAANQTLPAASVTGTHTAFRSTGIDDNADALAITIDSSENVGIGTTSVANAASWGTVLQLGDSTSCAFSLKDTGGKQFDIGTSSDSLYLGYDATSGAHRLSLTDTQVKIHTGDLVFGTAGKGVVLGNTSNVDANTLDDYEEGTWTPGQGSGVTLVGSYSSSGQYTKIGRMVTVRGNIAGSTSVTVGGANSPLCTGLPFAPTAPEFIGGWVNGLRTASGNASATNNSGVQSSVAIATTIAIYFTITYFI